MKQFKGENVHFDLIKLLKTNFCYRTKNVENQNNNRKTKHLA